MTPEKVKYILGCCQRMVSLHAPKRFEGDMIPQSPEAFAHLHWMTIQASRFVDEGRIEKAMRWAGFIHGVLWKIGTVSLKDIKRMSMPEDATFEEDGGVSPEVLDEYDTHVALRREVEELRREVAGRRALDWHVVNVAEFARYNANPEIDEDSETDSAELILGSPWFDPKKWQEFFDS